MVLAVDTSALVTQRVTLILEDDAGNRIDGAADEIRVPTSGDITTSIFASLPTAPTGTETYSSTGSVGIFGQLGVQANRFGGGGARMVNQVIISSDEHVNLTGIERNAVANFIIDGGNAFIEAGPGSILELQVNLEAVIFRGDNTFLRRESWQGGFEVEEMLGPVDGFRAFGEDLKATFNGSGAVDIPFSFQTFDIGTIPPAGRIELEYFLHIEADMLQFSELTGWQFSDPLTIQQGGGRQEPTFSIVFSPVNGDGPNIVPEPITATLGLMGLGTLGMAIRRRSV